jgi:pyrroloquinoline quinone biosynthesis protein B
MTVRRNRASKTAALALALAITACGAPPVEEPPTEPAVTEPEARIAGPFVRVIGTAQDGGLPHIACTGDNCTAARHDPSRRRLVSSLAIVLPESGRVFLIDATPDIHEQLDLLADVRDAPEGRVDRAPVDGVLLTHAHIGHYLGLALFGYEAVSASGMPVWGTPSMLAFLRENGPWSLLVERENIELREIGAQTAVELGDGVEVRAIAVPHRDEYTDTVGYLISGARQTLFYVPDTDSWRAWDPAIEEVLAEVDVALLDGSFFSTDELPGRSVEEIGHPLIGSSLERLAPVVEAGETEIYFTHFNHSNPVLDPESTARERVLRLGFKLLDDGEEIEL